MSKDKDKAITKETDNWTTLFNYVSNIKEIDANTIIGNEKIELKKLVGRKAAEGTNEYEVTIFILAAEKGLKSVVEKLIKLSDNFVNSLSSNGSNALHFAAQSGHVEIVKLILNKYPDLIDSVTTEDNNTALHWASMAGMTEVCEVLLNKKPELFITVNKAKKTPFDEAIANNHIETQKLLQQFKLTVCYDDSSSEEDLKEFDTYNLKLVGDTITELDNNWIPEQNIRLSFIAHELGLRLVKSPLIGKNYFNLKQKYLSNEDITISKVQGVVNKAVVDNLTMVNSKAAYDRQFDDIMNSLLANLRQSIKFARKKSLDKVIKKEDLSIITLWMLPVKIKEKLKEIYNELRHILGDTFPIHGEKLKYAEKIQNLKFNKLEQPLRHLLIKELANLTRENNSVSEFEEKLKKKPEAKQAFYKEICLNLQTSISDGLKELKISRKTLDKVFSYDDIRDDKLGLVNKKFKITKLTLQQNSKIP